eukprot:gnl/TRDRNA2_/TRDRNA2_44576_c0_seq1.p1 gnl/TRDRNA2_/TRDRNA2_44576_c0~~gnl/TRDRNA2_/TRDRNA2_44576_c0_seq1.p1  ORF type:complete len:216 (+),score=42.12 gnl/TRDRNA2_/TRDRNA2_44576_c0_seq1:371-1018(+)
MPHGSHIREDLPGMEHEHGRAKDQDLANAEDLANAQDLSALLAAEEAPPPPWATGKIEKPQGIRNMGHWKAAVYTPEQQTRLGVDEWGQHEGSTPEGSTPEASSPEVSKVPGSLSLQEGHDVHDFYDDDGNGALDHLELLAMLQHLNNAMAVPMAMQDRLHVTTVRFCPGLRAELRPPDFHGFLNHILSGGDPDIYAPPRLEINPVIEIVNIEVR